MPELNFNFGAALRTVRTIYFAMVIGQLLFMIVAALITEDAGTMPFDLSYPLNLALIIVTLGAISTGGMVSRRIFSSVKPDQSLRERMSVYQTGLIIRMASYEAVSLFAIVTFIMSSNLLVLLFALISLIGQVMVYPTTRSIESSVGIRESETYL